MRPGRNGTVRDGCVTPRSPAQIQHCACCWVCCCLLPVPAAPSEEAADQEGATPSRERCRASGQRFNVWTSHMHVALHGRCCAGSLAACVLPPPLQHIWASVGHRPASSSHPGAQLALPLSACGQRDGQREGGDGELKSGRSSQQAFIVTALGLSLLAAIDAPAAGQSSGRWSSLDSVDSEPPRPTHRPQGIRQSPHINPCSTEPSPTALSLRRQ